MNTPRKIDYHDLRIGIAEKRVPESVGRSEEMERLSRIIGRRMNSNVALVGPGGIGKSALVHGWMHRLYRDARYDSFALLQLDVEHIYSLDDVAAEERFSEAFSLLPPCVLFVDDFGHAAHQSAEIMQRVYRLYKQILKKPDIHVVLSLEPQEYSYIEREHPAFVHLFETIVLKNQTAHEYKRILTSMVPHLNARHRIIVPDTSLKEIIAQTERFPVLGQMPRSAIQLLDESISMSATKRRKILTPDSIAEVVEAKTGVPKAQLGADDLEGVKVLEERLNERIIDQRNAIAKIAAHLQRAKLGLKNPQRPLGSFLLLGPSGVGKTETAKCVAEIMFGASESFTRFDMSEFQQDHTVQRLIGAPAGYIGYEEGGALTNALKKNPHSLILLDEIEKAHPKVFDIFLQVLDDGRLTSGENETVDAKNAIFMATSNVGVVEILEAYADQKDADDESFVKERIMPVLAKSFRLEFINRFDSVLIFKPLAVPSLMRIARLEMSKIEKRLEKHRVQFEIESNVLETQVKRFADPRFGARPVKRFVEETCETLLVQSLLGADTYI